MGRKVKTILIFIFTTLAVLIISALLTLAISQARSLIGLYTVSAAPPVPGGAGGLTRPGLSSDLLILVATAGVLFLLTARRPGRLLSVAIVAALLFFALNLYSGRHLLPQPLIPPSPVSLAEQYVQALGANDLAAALRLTDRSETCQAQVTQAFQEHQALLNQKVGESRPASLFRSVSVPQVATFYDKPAPQGFSLMQPAPKQLVSIAAQTENSGAIWLNLKMSYTPILGQRYICGQEIDDSSMARTK